MFIETPASKASLSKRTRIAGVGLNDSSYKIQYIDDQGKKHTCPYYSVWASMLYRCFAPKLHAKRPNYAHCTVEEAWKTFTNFRRWMETQDWPGKHLDKDLLILGNKHYGPDTCLFINANINNLLVLRANHRGNLPLGVSKTRIKGHEYIVASCSLYGKQTRLGYFKTVEEAAEKYREVKLQYIADLAKNEKDPRVRQALLNLH